MLGESTCPRTLEDNERLQARQGGRPWVLLLRGEDRITQNGMVDFEPAGCILTAMQSEMRYKNTRRQSAEPFLTEKTCSEPDGIYGVIWSMDGASSRTSYKIELEPYCRYELGELYGRRGTNV